MTCTFVPTFVLPILVIHGLKTPISFGPHPQNDGSYLSYVISQLRSLALSCSSKCPKLIVLYLTSCRTRRQLAIYILLVTIGLACGYINRFMIGYTYADSGIESYQSIRPVLSHIQRNKADPIRWLKENSNDKHVVSTSFLPRLQIGRPRAALISLVRNAELPGMIESIKQMEHKWNAKYQVYRRISDEPAHLTNCSIHGSSSTRNLSQKNSRSVPKMPLQPNVTTLLSQKNTGRFPIGSTRAGF